MHFTSTAAVAVVLTNSALLGASPQKQGPPPLTTGTFFRQLRQLPSARPENDKPLWYLMKQIPKPIGKSPIVDKRECDLDIGILTCDVDQKCAPSHLSRHGGVCRPVRAVRKVKENSIPTIPAFCEMEEEVPPGFKCDCAKMNSTTRLGEISCTNDEWCDPYDHNLCGNASIVLNVLNLNETNSVKFSYCVQSEEERLCMASTVTDWSEMNCESATMNNCPCECQTVKCDDKYDSMSLLLECPNDVSLDACNGVSDFFGNKIESCSLQTAKTPGTSPAETTPGSHAETFFKPLLTVGSAIVYFSGLLMV